MFSSIPELWLAAAQATGAERGGLIDAVTEWDFFQFTVTLVGLIIVLGLTHHLLERRRLFRLPAIGNQLILLALTFGGLLAVIAALPGNNDEILNILGIVLGAALAFSSTTFIGNGLAGVMLRTMRSFEIGDWLKVEEHFGAVLERGLFHTLIQTVHLDLETLPNLYLTSQPFTVIPARDRMSRTGKVRVPGTRISAEVSLGYGSNHSQVDVLLREAVETCGLDDPRVQILKIGDFTVTYRVQGVTNEIDRLLAVRSQLNAAVLDTLHSAGIEIASPTLMDTRARSPDTRYMAKPSRSIGPSAAPSAAEEEVDLPEAVEARELDTQRIKLEQQVDDLQQRVKEAEGAEKERLEAELEKAQKSLDELGGDGPRDESTA